LNTIFHGERKAKLKRNFLTALAAILLALTACGRQQSPDVADGGDILQTVAADTYWTEKQWIHNGEPEAVSMRPLYLTEQVDGLDVEPDEAYDGRSVAYCTLGNIIYGLEDFYRQTGDGWRHLRYISRYDGTDEGISRWPIELPAPQEYGAKEFSVAAFDIKGEEELVLFLQGWQDELPHTACYLAAHMTPEGGLLSVTDLYPAMRELDVEMEAVYTKAYVDGDGYYYLISGQADYGAGTRVNVLDPDGEIVGTMEPGEGYDSGVKWAMKLPDGGTVFSWSGQGNILMQTYDKEKKAPRTLMEEKLFAERLGNAWLWTPGVDGYLYYVNSNEELTRCDIRTGSVEECMFYPQLGLDGDRRSEQLTRIIIGTDGEPELLGSKEGKTVICRLGTEKPEKAEVRLLSAGWFSDYIKNGVASFCQKYPDCPVVLEYPSENEEAYWERAMAELVSGKGADMYFVSMSEMRMLQEKGVLADLSALLSEETLSALWPAALERGTLDGYLVGITLEAMVNSMLVSDEIWEADHWTLEETLEVLEAHPETQYPLVSNVAFDSSDVLSWLVMENLADSPFLDLETASCDFSNPLFIRALELAGTYTKSFDFHEAQALYPEKDWVAMRINVEIGNFDDYKNKLGEDYHIVGFPTEAESGTYWETSQRFLVVNKDMLRETGHAEIIATFLEELLSYENQCTLYEPVRRDMLDNRLRAHSIGGETGMYIEYGDGLMRELAPGPEGDYRIGEYQAVMEGSVGLSTDTSVIKDIIWEEVGSYFSGVKDAATVADIIQSRVLLYLKERQ